MKTMFFLIAAFALQVFSGYDTLWTKTYSRPGNDVIYSVRHLTDGSLVVAGSVQDTGTKQYDAAIMKTDALGRQLWLKTYGTAMNEEARWIEPLTNGFVIVGSEYVAGSARQKIWILFLDAGGDTTRTVFAGDATRDYEGYCIRQTADKGFIIAATASLPGYFGATYSLCVVRLAADGSLQWLRRYSANDTYGAVLGRGVVELANGQFVVAGGNGFLRLNAAGDSLRVRTYATWVNGHGSYSVTVNGIDKTLDGKLVLVGSSWDTTSHQNFSYPYYNIWLADVDTNGYESWVKTFGAASYSASEYGNSVETLADSGYLVAGIFGNAGWVCRTGSNGAMVWSVSVGGFGSYGACRTGTENFAAAGGISNAAPVNTDMYLARIGFSATSMLIRKSIAISPNTVFRPRLVYGRNCPGNRIVTSGWTYQCNGQRTGKTSDKESRIRN
jgi:hypothetical protein